MNNTDEKICVIKEQGDLGLFADEISEEEKAKIDKNLKDEDKEE